MPQEPLPSAFGGSEPNPPDTGADEFEQAVLDVERSLFALKDRYAQVQIEQQRQAELQQHLKQVRQEWQRTHLPQLQGELRQIKEQLKELEIALESRLLTDSNLRALFWQELRYGLLGEVFWQAVRFAGLGIVVGWILKSCGG